MPSLGGASSGAATFNFEGESVHAVVKAILGDLLQQNYVIAPGVQGQVTLATPRPVNAAQALGLLEMVLGWNNARMVYSGGRYNIVAADQALAGTVAPSTAPASSARGFEVRVVPLQFKQDGWQKLGLTGEEIVTIRGLSDANVGKLRPRQDLWVELFRPSDGKMARFPVRCRIDNQTELDYFKAGGVMPYVLRNLARGTAE